MPFLPVGKFFPANFKINILPTREPDERIDIPERDCLTASFRKINFYP